MTVFKELMTETFGVTKTDLDNLVARYAADYSMDELEPIIRQQGNILTVAAAGSGKTTSLILKYLYDDFASFGMGEGALARRPRVWISTFLKAGAEDLELKLSQYAAEYNVKPTADVTCSTLHSVYYHIIKNIVPNVQIISPLDQMKFIQKAFRLKNDEQGRDRANDLLGVMTLINNLISREDPKVGQAIEGLKMKRDEFFEGYVHYSRLKMEAELYDFDDLQRIIYNNAVVKADPSFVAYIQDQFDIFYLDEFQDISPIQYAILKVQAAKAIKVFAIGDDDQTIYTWRGSDNDIILNQFREDFDPEVLQLTVNYRCPSRILEPALRVINHNEARYPKDIKPSNEGGTFKARSFSDSTILSKHLMDEVRDHMSKGHNLTVLARTNVTALTTMIYLEAEGTIDYGYFGSKIHLTTGNTGTYLLAPLFVEGLVESPKTLRLLLRAYDIKVSWFQLRKVANSMRTSGYSLITMPKVAMEVHGIYDEEFYNDLQSVANGERSTIDMVLHAFSKLTHAGAGPKLLASVIDAYGIETVEHLNNVINRLQKRLDYRHRVETGDMIVTTIHGYKGLENDHIIVAPVQDGSFPSNYDPETGLMSNLHIEDPELLLDMSQRLLEEERRLFYIAITRARVSCSIYSIGEDNIFMRELSTDIPHITSYDDGKYNAKLDDSVAEVVF